MIFCPRCTIDHPPELCPLNPEVQRHVQQAQAEAQASTTSSFLPDPNTVTSFATNLFDLGVDIITGLPKKAEAVVKTAGDCVGSAYDSACEAASSAVEVAGEAASAVGEGAASMVDGVADAAGSVVEAAGDIISSIADI